MNPARKSPFFLRLAVVTLVLSSLEMNARAQTDPSIAVAEALFQEARTLAGEKKWDDACPKFAESQRLDPKLGTLLNLAHCHEQQEKFATAWAEYTSAASLAHRSGHNERETFARERVAELFAKLAYVEIRMPNPPSDLQLLIDGQTISATVLNAPLPIDPGKHMISVKAPGRTGFSTEIDVPSNSTRMVLTIPTLPTEETQSSKPPEVQPAPSTNTGSSTPSIAAPSISPSSKDVPRGQAKVVAIASFTVAGAGAIVGTVAGLATLSKASEILPDCDGLQCSSKHAGNISSANTMANVSNVGFGLSVLGLAGGIIGVVMMPKSNEPASKVSMTPVIGPGIIGLRGTF